jgi:hypothetical protein
VSIWDEERRLTTALGGWAAVSVIGGGALALVGARSHRPTLLAFGRQNALWGAVDGVIAGGAAVMRRRRLARLPDVHVPEVVDQERRRLRRTLLVNAGLDVGYLAAGAGLVLVAGRLDRRYPGRGPKAVGDGAAIVLQGSFLLGLDTTFARRL